MSRLAALLGLLLPTQGPLGPQTLADPGQYLVQSANCDGNPATPLTERTPITCRRIDFGNYQIEDTFVMPNGSYATDWSYPPFGAFVYANGDGGEQYVIKNGVVTITETLTALARTSAPSPVLMAG